jgi:hypothetical protein
MGLIVWARGALNSQKTAVFRPGQRRCAGRDTAGSSCTSEKGVRLTRKMLVGPCIPVGIQI